MACVVLKATKPSRLAGFTIAVIKQVRIYETNSSLSKLGQIYN